jgi:hypothetical protein
MVCLVETAMRRFSFLTLVMALVLASSSVCQAAGSFQTKPMFSDVQVAKAGASAEPAIKPPQPSAGYQLGCGRGRVRDPETHGCRGPADIR